MTSSDAKLPASFRQTVRRALRLRCPACGQGPLFHGWFRMPPRCFQCGRVYDRAPGYFLGSIYMNYSVTALAVVAGFFAGYFSEVATAQQLSAVLAAFALLFPLWFFRYSRALWMAFDERWDPWPNEEERRAGSARQGVGK